MTGSGPADGTPSRLPNGVLVVEDSRALRQLLCARLAEDGLLEPFAAGDLAATRALLEQRQTDLFCAVLDLNLPDAPDGEVVDLVRSRNLPVIVLTGNLSDELRLRMLTKQVVDYVVKQNSGEIDYVTDAVLRIYHNQSTKVLVVDDARSTRLYQRQLLEGQQYQVFEAGNGEQALDVLRENPDIRLLLTDYNMPGMDGQELIQRVRRDHSRGHLAILGLSGQNSEGLSARLLKSGASDFMHKPFQVEEFTCRVNQNIDMIRHIRTIHDNANRDYLTRLYNRRYLFDAGEHLLAGARRGGLSLAVAMLDIDYFKKLNDRYGHDVGDQALVAFSRVLSSAFRGSDIVTRFGGEEFCVIAANVDAGNARTSFERVRGLVEQYRLLVDGDSIGFTCSIGVCTGLRDSLDAMIRVADTALYRAKEGGRNRVVMA